MESAAAAAAAASNSSKKLSPFAQAMKRYKRSNSTLQEEWVDLLLFQKGKTKQLVEERSSDLLLRVVSFPSHPGLLVFPRVLSRECQDALAHQAVTTYCQKPHKTNLDGYDDANERKEKRNKNDACHWEEWKAYHRLPKQQTKGKPKPKLEKGLSWGTMGYHYNWTDRSYHRNECSPMPELVARVSSFFANEWHAYHHNKSWCGRPFVPSAAICNFYHETSVMGGHSDDLEQALEQPIVSISLGRSALFLMESPLEGKGDILPLVLRAGDVVCWGGPTRLAVHGMPRLLPVAEEKSEMTSQPNESCLFKDVPCIESEAEQAALAAYLKTHRVNLNVRQVYSDDSI